MILTIAGRLKLKGNERVSGEVIGIRTMEEAGEVPYKSQRSGTVLAGK